MSNYMKSGKVRRLALMLEIQDERNRQIHFEDYSIQHHDTHNKGELSLAAASIMLNNTNFSVNDESNTKIAHAIWPFEEQNLKIGNYNDNLIKASALILAELERLDRFQESVEFYEIDNMYIYAADCRDSLDGYFNENGFPYNDIRYFDRDELILPEETNGKEIKLKDLFIHQYGKSGEWQGAGLVATFAQ